MSDKMLVKYACKGCGVKDVEVPVRFRWSSEDIVYWMEKVAIKGVSADHTRRSPWCVAKTVDLSIPVPDGTQQVGARVLQ